MSKELFGAVDEFEIAKRAIPELKRMLENGSYCYMGATLFLNIRDHRGQLILLDVRPITDIESAMMREAQYLVSKMYVKHKGEGYSAYEQALLNVRMYEI